MWVCFEVVLFAVILWLCSLSAPCNVQNFEVLLCGYLNFDLFMRYL